MTADGISTSPTRKSSAWQRLRTPEQRSLKTRVGGLPNANVNCFFAHSIAAEPTLGTRRILGRCRSEGLLEQSNIAMPRIGTIVLPNANGAIECLIQEMTETGARLKLTAPHRVPRHFQFASRNASPRKASVVWWDIEAVGIRFMGK